MRSRAALIGSALLQQISMLPGTAARAGRGSSKWTLVDAPDSRLCREAFDHARGGLSTPVLLHSLRCWHYASALAAVDVVEPDPEALYVACILHDIALGCEDDPQLGCFALLGAERARAFVVERGGDVRTGEVVHAAIAAHMNIATPDGAEAALLHDAAYLDVSGRRIRDVDPGCFDAIESTYPRDDFAAIFGSAMKREVRVRPKSTAAVLWRAGMPVALAANPLERRRR